MAIFTILYGNYYPPQGEFKLICIGKFARRTWVNFTQQYRKNRQRRQQNTYYYAVWQLLLYFYREFPSKIHSVWLPLLDRQIHAFSSLFQIKYHMYLGSQTIYTRVPFYSPSRRRGRWILHPRRINVYLTAQVHNILLFDSHVMLHWITMEKFYYLQITGILHTFARSNFWVNWSIHLDFIEFIKFRMFLKSSANTYFCKLHYIRLKCFIKIE